MSMREFRKTTGFHDLNVFGGDIDLVFEDGDDQRVIRTDMTALATLINMAFARLELPLRIDLPQTGESTEDWMARAMVAEAAVAEIRAESYIAIWDEDGTPNAQAYVTREAAERDFPEGSSPAGTTIVQSTVQN